VVITDLRDVELQSGADLQCAGYDYLDQQDKYLRSDRGADFIFLSELPSFPLPGDLGAIVEYTLWKKNRDQRQLYPVFDIENLSEMVELHPELNFVQISWPVMGEGKWDILSERDNLVLLLGTSNAHGMAEMRRFFFELIDRNIGLPVVLNVFYPGAHANDILLYASTDMGGLLVDGLGDGIMIGGASPEVPAEEKTFYSSPNDLSFGILQAAGARITKTEYISSVNHTSDPFS
jgi:(E)-4-hydroxy-3-methylbut-2-enyl-diphosphate synthase